MTIPIVFMPGAPKDWKTYSLTTNRAGVSGEIRDEGTWTLPANSCAYTLNPPNLQTGGAQLKGTVHVLTDPGCPWLATSTASWIQLTSALRSEGPGNFDFTLPANTGQDRTGTVTVMGTTFTVIQSH